MTWHYCDNHRCPESWHWTDLAGVPESCTATDDTTEMGDQ